MVYSLGIDLGTTFTSAAIHRDGRAEIASLGDRAAAIPSVLFVREDGGVVTGDPANRRAISNPDRVARQFKRRFGDTTPLFLGGSPYSAEALMAKLLSWVYQSVTQLEDEPPRTVAVSYPASWGPYKRELLEHAIELAELDNAVLVTEPEAAAVHYASQERFEPGNLLAVYDLGGGTFDTVILRKNPTGFEMVGDAIGLERLGGIDFDAAIFHHVSVSLGGALEQLDPDDPVNLAAIARLRQECTDAKEALSRDTEASIPVVLPNLATEVRLTRAEFEDLIRPSISETITALERAMSSAGVEADDIARVLLVGGSSRIPLVTDMVSTAIGRPVGVDAHPKHAIALGAAAVAANTQPQAPAQPAGASPAGAEPETVEPSPLEPAHPEPVTNARGSSNKVLIGAALAVALAALAAGAVALFGGGSDQSVAASPAPTQESVETAAPTTEATTDTDEDANEGSDAVPEEETRATETVGATDDTQTGDEAEVVNMARVATVTGSSERGGPVERANDGIGSTPETRGWGAGQGPPAWIEFDLGQLVTVDRIEATPHQSPPELSTRHVFLGRQSLDDAWTELHVASQITFDNEPFTVPADTDWPQIRYLRINTTNTQSSVAWGEVEIHGTPETPVTLPAPELARNLATTAEVTASSAQVGDTKTDAIDGRISRTNSWVADGPAPQWIQLELGGPEDFDEIVLHTWEDPEGLVRFGVEVAGADQEFTEIVDREALLWTEDRLSIMTDGGFTDVQFIRITTLESDNPPTWAEIQVLVYP